MSSLLTSRERNGSRLGMWRRVDVDPCIWSLDLEVPFQDRHQLGEGMVSLCNRHPFLPAVRSYVAEHADKGWVAHQRPLKVGPILGSDYVVLEGIRAGDQVIVSGSQNLMDGAPIAITQ